MQALYQLSYGPECREEQAFLLARVFILVDKTGKDSTCFRGTERIGVFWKGVWRSEAIRLSRREVLQPCPQPRP